MYWHCCMYSVFTLKHANVLSACALSAGSCDVYKSSHSTLSCAKLSMDAQFPHMHLSHSQTKTSPSSNAQPLNLASSPRPHRPPTMPLLILLMLTPPPSLARHSNPQPIHTHTPPNPNPHTVRPGASPGQIFRAHRTKMGAF